MSTNLSPAYTNCTNQGTVLNLPGTAKMSVAFAPANGRQGRIFYRNLIGPVICDPSTFDAPPTITDYQCCVAPIPSIYYDNDGNPIGFTKCATDEASKKELGLEQVCHPDNNNLPADIIYGAKGNYVYASAVSAPCSTNIFGDPNLPDVTNNCYWRPSLIPLPAPAPKAPPITARPWVLILILVAIAIVLWILFTVVIIAMQRNSYTNLP